MTDPLTPEQLDEIESITLSHYGDNSHSFWQGTKDHDVSQNYRALLGRFPASQALDVLDFGCGPGRDLAYFKSRGHRPVGLEGSDELVARARDNASSNGIDNALFEAADLYSDEPRAIWPSGRFDRVLLDPPRSGAWQVLPLIAETGARRLVYVSCNPETLARDAASLVNDHGYILRKAGIMDMFPQSTHIETMALFERS